MKIEDSKIAEALDLCLETIRMQSMSLHQVEVLLGKMLYTSKLATPARRFLNRLLQFRRTFQHTGHKIIPEGVKSDLAWFTKFLMIYNGQAMIRSRLQPSLHIYTDASLMVGGAYIKDYGFMDVIWPEEISSWDVAITELEVFMLLVAIRYWAHICQATWSNTTFKQQV